jgi:hypothetical protein
MSKPKASTEAQAKLELAIADRCPDLPPGAVKGVANAMAGMMTNNSVAQFQDREKIAQEWGIKFELLKEIDANFKDEYKNVRKAMSQRLMAVANAANETLMIQLSDPDIVKSISPPELAKTIKYLTDASVTLDDGHKAPVAFDLSSMAGIKQLLGNPQVIAEMKKLNGKEISKQ